MSNNDAVPSANPPEDGMPDYFKLRIDQYLAMHRLTIIPLEHDVEFWGGVIFKKVPVCDAGRQLLKRVESALRPLLPPEVTLCVSRPIIVGDGVPQPDLAILPSAYVPTERVVQLGPISLMIELAETVEFANYAARRIYFAAAGISEYWLINVLEKRIDRYWNPSVDGFLELRSYGMTENIPMFLNQQQIAEIAIQTIFPPETTNPVTT